MNGMGKANMRQGLTVLVGLLAAVLLTGCGETENKAVKPETVSGLRVQKIELKNVPDELEAPGTVIAAATAQVAARTMGTVLQVAVKEGDAVKVKLLGFDDRGKVRLSMKVVDQTTGEDLSKKPGAEGTQQQAG